MRGKYHYLLKRLGNAEFVCEYVPKHKNYGDYKNMRPRLNRINYYHMGLESSENEKKKRILE